MNESIFRKKSLDRISSPEKIDEYMKVTNPSMWLGMVAIILLLVAAVIWSITGRIETTVKAEGQAENSQVKMMIPAENVDNLAVGSEARAAGKVGQVTEITKQQDDYLVIVSIPKLQDGTVDVTLVTERIAPITFLTE